MDKQSFGILLLVVLVAVSTASAEQIVDETRRAAPDGVVSIELISGRVEVIGSSTNEVHITGTLGDDVEELAIEEDDGEIHIEVRLPDTRRSLKDASARLEIHVPEGSTLEFESVSANVSVEDLTGVVEIESVSGTVTVSGFVREIEVETVSGDIEVETREALREAEFESVSGDIDLHAPLDPDGDFSFETVSGDVTLRLPSDTSADFDIETFSGSVSNEFGSSRGESRSQSFSIGAGTADVQIESFSGRIEVKQD